MKTAARKEGAQDVEEGTPCEHDHALAYRLAHREVRARLVEEYGEEIVSLAEGLLEREKFLQALRRRR